MIGRALRGAVVLLAGFVLVAGCGSDRPAELSVDEVKPCELIPQSAHQRLRIAVEPQSLDTVSGVGTEGRTCAHTTNTGNSVYVSTITNHGIGRWVDPSFEHVRSEEAPRIQGYRTVKVWRDSERPDPDSKCKVYVDVAGGQSLRVQVGMTSDEEDPPTCDTARRFAETAMGTLVADRG
ncbi:MULTISPECIES: DUF3558 family protein [unclassified Actinopolyspora]|uniref:DUF3558 family protein n=1 Tax=unclassified Actinopolyspora TaxID=2639451 RepID=UPI0013F68CC9|nr:MULTISPECIES: DUF3558 family protein [unclassified Actinopolyspora]NHD16201.1 DUF3558 family protein [Actinopolyspora sp. BKK2]NHE75936.1 DUF3558 family protein [Actinopolyspora sp. BKK1]